MKPQPNPNPYGDFLGLAERRFADARLIVFTGISGSGKSTAIRFLLENHPDFADADHELVDSKPLAFRDAYDAEWIVVDEILEWAHIAPLVRLLRRGHRLLVASHVPAPALKFVLAPWRGIYFSTRDVGKIARYLERLGVSASDAAVAKYCERYGTTFTDVDIILERFPDMDFDTALRRFERFCRID